VEERGAKRASTRQGGVHAGILQVQGRESAARDINNGTQKSLNISEYLKRKISIEGGRIVQERGGVTSLGDGANEQEKEAETGTHGFQVFGLFHKRGAPVANWLLGANGGTQTLEVRK